MNVEESTSFDTNGFATGVYFVKSGNAVKKLVVE